MFIQNLAPVLKNLPSRSAVSAVTGFSSRATRSIRVRVQRGRDPRVGMSLSGTISVQGSAARRRGRFFTKSVTACARALEPGPETFRQFANCLECLRSKPWWAAHVAPWRARQPDRDSGRGGVAMPWRKPWHDVQGESLKAAPRVSQARSKTPACWPVRQHRPLEAKLRDFPMTFDRYMLSPPCLARHGFLALASASAENLASPRPGKLSLPRPGDRSTKKPKRKERKVAIRIRVKPSVKAMAERLAQQDARSMADWLERLIARERARRARKRLRLKPVGPSVGS
jgi:hypothetical protein